MSPVSTATRDQAGQRPHLVQSIPTAEMFVTLAKEMVVDWQLADQERKG